MLKIALILLLQATTPPRILAAPPAPESGDRPATSTSSGPWPPGAPIVAALIVHGGRDDQLALADLVQGRLDYIAGPGATEPVWSPDGVYLAYRDGAGLQALQVDQRQRTRVPVTLSRSPERSYAFSPASDQLAVASDRAVEVFSLRKGETPSRARLIRIPRGFQLQDLTWSSDGAKVAACGWNQQQGAQARSALIEMDATAEQGKVLAEVPGCGLLGVREAQWVVKRRPTDEQRDEVAALAKHTAITRLYRAPEEWSVDRYLDALDAALILENSEDTGDPTVIDLVHLPQGRRQAWLRRFKRLQEFTFTTDGRFVLFVQGSAMENQLGGAVFLALADGTSARQVLPHPGVARGKTLTYSGPTPRPVRMTPSP